MKRSYSTLLKIFGLVLIIALPYFIYTYFFTPQRVGINEVSLPTNPLDPQYIFIRKSTTCTNCYIWNGHDSSQYSKEAFLEIINGIGSRGTTQRKLGIGAVFEINAIPVSTNLASLKNLLIQSQEQEVPIYLLLNSFAYLNDIQDIFKWWEPGLPPQEVAARKNNVEWTCWDQSCATKKAWRNWGSEIEVGPQPNLASTAVINKSRERLTPFVQEIYRWYLALPAHQKYLFGGLSTGGEIDIGGNYYYYPNGISTGGGLKDSVQLGYAAVSTLGSKNTGQLTSQDLDKVVSNYLTILNKTAYDSGIPRNKIFNHVGGKGLAPFTDYPENLVFAQNAALNTYAQPGWSFYGNITNDPKSSATLNNTLNQIQSTEWASPEWLPWAVDEAGWLNSLNESLNYRNNRFINISNWEDIRNTTHALTAIKKVLNTSPSCWVETPRISVSINNNSATITWIKGTHNDSLHLQASKSGEYTFSGFFPTNNLIANSEIGSVASHDLQNLTPGKYYVTLITNGCNSSQSRVAYANFEIPSVTTKPGDLNGDGKVNIYDYSKLISGYGTLYTNTDFINILANYGK